MNSTFSTIILKDKDKNATGIQVPAGVVAVLGSGKKPKVKVGLNGHTYRTTVAVMSDVYMFSLSSENRKAAGVNGGDTVDVTLELDTEPRTVEVPDDLALALSGKPATRVIFDALSYSVRKEYVRQVESAKA